MNRSVTVSDLCCCDAAYMPTDASHSIPDAWRHLTLVLQRCAQQLLTICWWYAHLCNCSRHRLICVFILEPSYENATDWANGLLARYVCTSVWEANEWLLRLLGEFVLATCQALLLWTHPMTSEIWMRNVHEAQHDPSADPKLGVTAKWTLKWP